MSDRYDVIVIGAGIIGASVAYHLMEGDSGLDVLMLDRDMSFEVASTSLSMANVRTQFELEENILISKYTKSILADFDERMCCEAYQPRVDFRKEGNLFLFFIQHDNHKLHCKK